MNTSNLVPFAVGYDARREGNGVKTGTKSIRKYFKKFLEMSPEEFYKIIGFPQVPPQFTETKNMLEAIVAVNIGVALGHIKGNRLKAASLIFDRAEGKAAQTITLETELTDARLEDLSDEDLRKIADADN